MANTFTTNYNLVKSEIGGDNQNWGTNIHETITEVDAQLVNKLDHGIVKGFSSGAISFTTGTNGTIASTSGDLFEDFKAADKVRISGSSNEANNGVHTVASKSSANAIVVSSALATVAAGDTITVQLVLEAGYIDAGPTTVDSLTVEGDTTIQGNTTLGTAGGTVTSLTIIDGGTGYTAGSFTISGGGGTGCTATFTVSSGVIDGYTITSAGSGYTSAPNVTASGGSGAVVVAHISASPDTIQMQIMPMI
jgi:hypothetical protein